MRPGDNSTKKKKNIPLNFIITNARSIENKIDSLYDVFTELELDLAIISESWTKPGGNFDRLVERSKHDFGLSTVWKHRPGRRKGGGVMIVSRDSNLHLEEYRLRRNGFEICAAKGKLVNVNRPVFVFSVYFSTAMKKAEADGMSEFISEEILRIKTAERDPIIIIGGDFNKISTTGITEDYVDIEEMKTTPPTRNNARLDLLISNVNGTIVEKSCIPPLRSSDDVASDHGLLLLRAELFSRHSFQIIKYKTRLINDETIAKFKDSLSRVEWGEEMKRGSNPTKKVDIFQTIVDKCLEETMPLRTKTKKSTDDPWINDTIRKAIKKRKRIFRITGDRNYLWKIEKKRCDALIEKAKQNYYDRELERAKSTSGSKLAYTAIRNLQCSERPKQWSVMNVADGKSETEIVEDLADYFSRITSDYQPIQSGDVPEAEKRGAITFTAEGILDRLKKTKKPKGTVPGDIPPKALSAVQHLLTEPLLDIFNCTMSSASWPAQWKKEYQTVIPKSSNAATFDQCRNIACTNHFSKILESFILDRLKEEVQLSATQFGGMSGCSVENFLIETWDTIFAALEEGSSAVNIMSVDFSKAFNRVDHTACLKKMAAMGASQESLTALLSFLSNRVMLIRTNNVSSSVRKVPGGAPQGTKLGNFLFCCAVDDIEVNQEATRDAGEAEQIAPRTPEESAVPEHYLPNIMSTPIERNDSQDQNRIANPFGLRQKTNIIRDTVLEEPNECEDGVEVTVVKYVDDVNVIERLDLGAAVDHFTTNMQHREIRATGCEAVFVNIKTNSKDVKMMINAKKTQSICISDCNYYTVSSYINTEDGRIENSMSLKILGFVFGNEPNANEHVSYLVKKFIKCSWSLTHLKRAGISQTDLIEVYKSSLRPVIEFCSVVYHALLTADQSERIERLQKRVLKIVYGFEDSYDILLQRANICPLKTRRENAVLKFARKMSVSPRFGNQWFPRWENEFEVNLREEKVFIEFQARTNRLYNSQLYQMRRILNAAR